MHSFHNSKTNVPTVILQSHQLHSGYLVPSMVSHALRLDNRGFGKVQDPTVNILYLRDVNSIPGTGSLVGCRLWGRTESDTTEVTQQQQQVGYNFPSKE